MICLIIFRKLRSSVWCNWIYFEHLSCSSSQTGGPNRFVYTFCHISILFGFVYVWILFAFAKCQIPLSVLYFERTVITDILIEFLHDPSCKSYGQNKYFFRDWVFGTTDGFMCKIFPILIYGQTCLTLLNVVAITISRYITPIK